MTHPERAGDWVLFGTLNEIRRMDPKIPIVMISGPSSDIVEAMKNGADDFIAKPINPDDLRKALKKAVGVRAHAAANVVEQSAPPARNHVF